MPYLNPYAFRFYSRAAVLIAVLIAVAITLACWLFSPLVKT